MPNLKTFGTATRKIAAFCLRDCRAPGFNSFLPADGAFYLYADVSRFSADSFAFATRMLEEAGVAATPGVDFDPVRGKHFLRLCYAGCARRYA